MSLGRDATPSANSKAASLTMASKARRWISSGSKRTPDDAALRTRLLDHTANSGIDGFHLLAVHIGVVARAGLAPQASGLAQLIQNGHVALTRITRRRLRLAHTPGNVEAGEIGHGERPHRKAQPRQRSIHVLGPGTILEHELALAAVGVVDPVADKAEGIPSQHRHLLQGSTERHAGGQHARAVFAPRTTSSSFITFAGLKKCSPSTSCGREVAAAIGSMSR